MVEAGLPLAPWMRVWGPMILLLGLAVAGWFPAGRWLGARAWGERLLFAWLVAIPSFVLVLFSADLVGVPWRPALLWTLVGAGALASSVCEAWTRRRTARGPRAPLGAWRPWRSSSGEGTGLSVIDAFAALLVFAAVELFALLSFLGWSVQSDFIFHWGIKAWKMHLASGFDWAYLSLPWNFHVHPDYPNLVPTLLASAAAVAGPQAEIPPPIDGWFGMAPVSMLWMAMLGLAAFALARRVCATPMGRLVAVVVAVWGMTGFSIGHRLAGGADLPLAAAAMAGALVLCGQIDPYTDRQMAWVAAFAAGTKLEGMALAAFLVAAHLGRRWWTGRRQAGPPTAGGGGSSSVGPSGVEMLRSGLARMWSTAWPTALMGAFWLYGVESHGLFLPSNTGVPELGRLWVVLPELVGALSLGEGLGLPLALITLPWLLYRRTSRWACLALTAQLGFYLYAYLAGPVDTAFWIRTSAPRLAFHVLPTLWILLIAEIDRATAVPELTNRAS